MTKKRLEILINRFYHGQCNPEELRELEDYYQSLDRKDYDGLPEEVMNKWERFAEWEYLNLRRALTDRAYDKKEVWMQSYKKVAVWIGLIGFALLSLYLLRNDFSHVKPLPAVVSYDARGNTEADSRYLKLPDGSVVILHAGSILKFDSSDFNKKNREIELTGEAYFDVAHNTDKPFIVHSGKVKVTVLGTAFNIKQSINGVSVTVTRGKVRVEEGKKLLGLLTPDQQIVYEENAETQPETVKADDATQWVKRGLTFNDDRLDSIARKLEIRYNVSVGIANDALARCRVSAGNPFSGTESLDEILSLICPAVNAEYKIEDNNVHIYGVGCDD